MTSPPAFRAAGEQQALEMLRISGRACFLIMNEPTNVHAVLRLFHARASALAIWGAGRSPRIKEPEGDMRA